MKKLFFFLGALALLAANAVAQPESMFGERTVSMTFSEDLLFPLHITERL